MVKKQIISALNRDLAKWVTLSEKFKKSSAIQYAKLKSTLAMFESSADIDELNTVQSQLGNLINEYFKEVFILVSEKHLQNISENATQNLDDCITDVDNLKPRALLKKRKRPKALISPSKKKKVARRLFAGDRVNPAVESLISKESIEGEC